MDLLSLKHGEQPIVDDAWKLGVLDEGNLCDVDIFVGKPIQEITEQSFEIWLKLVFDKAFI